MQFVYVLLPAFNEAGCIETLISKIASALRGTGPEFRILICNDGSTDDTASVLERISQNYPIEVLTHKLNRGLGESIRDLMERAAELADDGDFIVRMDCDDTHDPAYIKPMLERLEQEYDVVVASRFAPGGGQLGVPKNRELISLAANLYMRLVFPMGGLREYSCGFRAYRASTIRRAIRIFGNDFIQLRGLGFTCTLEKLIKLKLIGARCGEVPFVLRYDQKQGASKMVGNLTTLGYLIMALLYHWPWGGWRLSVTARIRKVQENQPGGSAKP